MSRRFPSQPLLMAMLLVLLLIRASASGAATFSVNSLFDASDTLPGDGICDSILAGVDCTLRAAVQEANALAGPDEITIPSLTIVLNIAGADDAALAGDLDITDDLTITGSAFTTLAATHGEHVIELRGGHLDLSGLQIQDGGIRSLSGTRIEITDVVIDQSILNEGIATLARVEITGATETALVNTGTLDGTDLDIHENSTTGLVGGIRNTGFMLLTNSRIQGNGVTGAQLGDSVAGILNEFTGVLKAANVAIIGNPNDSTAVSNLCVSAILNEGEMRLIHATVGGFGGACASLFFPNVRVFNSGTLRVGRSVFSPEPGAEPLCLLGSAPADAFISLDYNLFSDGTCLAALLSNDVIRAGSLFESTEGTLFVEGTDPVPEDLCPMRDWRGFSRPNRWLAAGPGCDRGAAEGSPTNPLLTFPACSNGRDDDGDGFTDLEDPGCRDADDPLEAHVRPGDVLVGNYAGSGLSALDPSTLRLSPISRSMGLVTPLDLAIDADGTTYAGDLNGGFVADVDIDTGTVLLAGAEGDLDQPTGLAAGPGGTLYVGDWADSQIVELDPTTRAQTVVASNPLYDKIVDLLPAGDGTLFVSDQNSTVYRVDPATGLIDDTFTAPEIAQPRQLAFDLFGDLVLADSGADVPLLLDPSLPSVATALLPAPAFPVMRGSSIEPTGMLLTTEADLGIYRVDPLLGTATLVHSGAGIEYLERVDSDLELTLTLDHVLVIDGGTSGVVDAGDTVELSAVVTNVGSTSADLLSLESGLHPNLTLVASQLMTTQGTIVEGSVATDPRLEVDLGSLAPSATATVTWQVDVADPTPARFVTANAWVRREKLILAESDDPGTGPVGDRTVMGVGDYGMVVGASQKISDIRGGLSGSGNPGALLEDISIFGRGPAALGDFDGDGRQEIVVGANRANADLGAAYLLDLEADGTVVATKEIGPVAGLLAGENFGIQVASLGDLDGAGPAATTIAVASLINFVYILSLDAAGDVISQNRIGYNEPPGIPVIGGGRFGTGIANLGDLDGGGPAALALAVGEPFNGRGGFYVLFLDSAGNLLSPSSYQHVARNSGGLPSDIPSSSSEFGYALAFLGNIDADPAPEIAVGAPRAESPFFYGEIWIMSLNPDGTVFNPWRIDRNDPAFGGQIELGDRTGASLTAIDLDGDGVPELAASAEGAELASNRPGSFWSLWLDPSTQSVARALETSATKGAFFEPIGQDDFLQEIRAIGDLDGDGISEIARGALLDNDGGQWRGALHILYPATPVPEPGQLLMLAAGAALLAALDRRRKKR